MWLKTKKVPQKISMLRHKNEWLSISSLGVFFPTLPLLIPQFYDVRLSSSSMWFIIDRKFGMPIPEWSILINKQLEILLYYLSGILKTWTTCTLWPRSWRIWSSTWQTTTSSSMIWRNAIRYVVEIMRQGGRGQCVIFLGYILHKYNI